MAVLIGPNHELLNPFDAIVNAFSEQAKLERHHLVIIKLDLASEQAIEAWNWALKPGAPVITDTGQDYFWADGVLIPVPDGDPDELERGVVVFRDGSGWMVVAEDQSEDDETLVKYGIEEFDCS